MLRVIKYVLDTKDLGLKIEPTLENGHWTVEAYSDSDWAGDPDNRQSVGSYIVFVNSVPVTWKSRSQKSVALSSGDVHVLRSSKGTTFHCRDPFVFQGEGDYTFQSMD